MPDFTFGFEFAHPAWLLILPLPYFIYRFIPAYQTRQTAVKVPFFSILIEALGEKPTKGAMMLSRAWWQHIAVIIGWILVVLAMAKPIILGEPQTRELMGRDIMVVVDLSGSMAEEDFTNDTGENISRLAAAKLVLNDFVETRKGDRLGLILFGDAAFVQTPFTPDHQAWVELLSQTEVAMAGQSTHLGDAIGLAIKVFSQEEENQTDTTKKEKVAIVLTDGNDTGSYVPPIDAAKVAKAKEVRIHMIAMGDPGTIGEKAIDMEVIRQVAEASGGKSFQALNRQELQQAYEEISKLEPTLFKSTSYRPKKSVHHYLLMIALLIYIGALSAALVNWSGKGGKKHA